MNFEKSVLQNQNVAKPEKKNKYTGKNDKEVDVVGRRNFLKMIPGAVAALAVNTAGFRAVENFLGDDKNHEEKQTVSNAENENKIETTKQEIKNEIVEKPIEEKAVTKKQTQEKTVVKEIVSKEEKQKKEKIKMLIENIIVAQSQIRQSKYWPKKIFTESELTALEMVESGLRDDRVSPKGAVGICQITKIGLKSDFEYMSELELENAIKIHHSISVSDEDLDMIMEQLLLDKNLNRAARDIHLSRLYKKFYMPSDLVKNISSKIRIKKNPNELHENILAMYNMGEGNFGKLNKEEWPSETKNFIVKNKKYIEKLSIIKKELAKRGERIHDYEKVGKQILLAET